MTEGWPDFWIRGKKIDLIDLIDEINTIHTIETINTVTNLGTLDTLNTIGTIQKINPQNTDNVVIDRVKTINTIEAVNNIGTLDTINTVDTINTIDKIKVIHDARIVPNLIQNGSFRTGSLEGWYKQKGDEYVEYDETYQEYVCILPTVNSGIAQFTQPILGNLARIVVRYNHEVDNSEIEIIVQYRDGTADTFDFTATTGGTWYDAVVEPTTNKPIRGIVIYNMTDGSELKITGIEMLRKNIVYQAEKDRTITNFPSEYPLPSSQISDLKNVNVQRAGSILHFSKSFTSAGSADVIVPGTGKAIRVLAWNFYVDADVTCELRFKNSGNVIAALPAKGATAMNLIGCTAPTGDTEEPVEIYVSDAANVKGWICAEEV